MRLKLELDLETAEKLAESAAVERRPLAWQAEVLLRRALGLAFPPEDRPHQDRKEVPADAA